MFIQDDLKMEDQIEIKVDLQDSQSEWEESNEVTPHNDTIFTQK